MTDLTRDVIVTTIPLVFHIIGLCFLIPVRHKSNQLSLGTGIQYIYLVLISINNIMDKSLILIKEINPGLSPWWFKFIFTLSSGGFFVAYILIMTLLTVDRFLEVYLNIRYPTIWSKRKTKICLLVCYLISVTIVVCLLLTCHDSRQSLGVLTTYIWPICHGVFIVTASVTYGYVLIKIRANRKRLANIHTSSLRLAVTSTTTGTSSTTSSSTIPTRDNEITTNVVIHDVSSSPPSTTPAVSSQRSANSRQSTSSSRLRRNPSIAIIKVLRGFYVPTLFIVTFLIFLVIPDMVYLGYFLNSRYPPEWINDLAAVLYALAPISDALIYTFAFRPVRQQLMICICWCFNGLCGSSHSHTHRFNYFR